MVSIGQAGNPDLRQKRAECVSFVLRPGNKGVEDDSSTAIISQLHGVVFVQVGRPWELCTRAIREDPTIRDLS
jgi:hypothetical protein